MLSLPSAIRIYLSRDAVDFRKSHDGLLAVVRDAFGDDPFDGSLFVFLNRRRDRVKLLQWDRDGSWLHYKRLEQGTFRLRVEADDVRLERICCVCPPRFPGSSALRRGGGRELCAGQGPDGREDGRA